MWCGRVDLCTMLRHCVLLMLFASCVSCLRTGQKELNIEEGQPCVTEGISGVCTFIYKCPIAFNTYTYRNAGYGERYKFPELPDICSYKQNYPVVCCTDCFRYNDTRYKDATVDTYGNLVQKSGKAAYDKCGEYFQNLPYPCRGMANIHFTKIYNEKKKCHQQRLQSASPVGGRDAERWEFPHVALLGYGADVDSAQWLCGGTVISERYVLTAAHCTSTSALGPIKFAALGVLKRTDPKKDWKIYDIKRIVIHPQYSSPLKYHDIALLETEKEINFGKDLLPACLNTRSTTDRVFEAEAAGWGRAGNRRPLSDNLQVVILDKYSETECSDIYEPHRLLPQGYDHETQMCYGSKKMVVDTCEGDSGGPLQTNEEKCQYYVVGVTSYGKNCGVLGSAGMYTRVAHYVPWIESVVWPHT